MGLPRIWVGFHSFGQCPTQFVVDIAKCLRYSGTIIPAVIHEQSCYVDSARNKIVKKFLAEPDASHLMMIDVDINFNSDAILKTFTVMQATHADLVYGNYPLGNGANSIFGPPDNKSREAAVRVGLEPGKVYTDIATGGTGWMMVTRQLLERMQRECEGPWHWFARDLTSDGSDRRGEDITFGLRAYALNPKPKIIGITNVMLRHLKYQGLYASFMAQAAMEDGGTGIAIPNPYENEPERFFVWGNSVIDKASLSPEDKLKLEKEYAESLGRQAKEGSGPEGNGQKAGRRVRVRNAPQDGVEAGAGAEIGRPDGHGEEVKNGAKRIQHTRKASKDPGQAN